jgi:TetR/AcrR family transcriptional regulator, copper-responsive repressor
MVQKKPTNARGRPKAYDPDVALQRAMETFWKFGYAGTSLDQLSDATDMNRPSLYAAFGDKHSLYVQTLKRYHELASAGSSATLQPDVPLQQALRAFYAAAVQLYLPQGAAARGCYMITTAVTEASQDTQVRAQLQALLHLLDDALRARIAAAIKAGELESNADADALAVTAAAFLHTLAIRARAGESRAQLTSIIDTAIAQICPSRVSKSRRK